MVELKYKTRGNTDPKGKPRVYFCCHPADFDQYFDAVSDDILAKQNCAIWFLNSETAVRDDDFFLALKQMQLVVMPITTNLLCSQNAALDIEFRFAIENHIPVLPLMQEEGLDELFNQKCGDLQFLDQFSKDSTVISYADKLEKYLSVILTGDELAQKIRSSFDAYVFLSYRKKDRKYAQELMRLIHNDDLCRDIAIWYDEYLVPGENFNNSILEALKKSDLFTLLVTPNILEDPNYVKDNEYPVAMKNAKRIVAAECVKTDREELTKKYVDIPPICEVFGSQKIGKSIYEALSTTKKLKENNEAQHIYYMGMAYLNGIDVEVNFDRARELIEKAANSEYLDAMIQMVSMYLHGKGVRRDIDSAIKWQEKIVKNLERKPTNDIDSTLTLLNELWFLGDFYWEILDDRHCLFAFKKMKRVCEEYNKNSRKSDDSSKRIKFARYYAIACEKIGNMLERSREFDAAIEHYRLALKAKKNAPKESAHYYYDISTCCKRLGIVYKEKGDYKKALKFFQSALDFCVLEYKNDGNADEVIYLISQVGKVCMEKGDIAHAREYWNEGLRFGQEHMSRYNCGYSEISSMSDCYCMLAQTAQTDDEALIGYKQAMDILDKSLQEQSTVMSMMLRSKVSSFISNTYLRMRMYNESEQWICQAIDIAEELYRKYSVSAIIANLALMYTNRGYFNKQTGNPKLALEWYQKSVSLLNRQKHKSDVLMELLASNYVMIGTFDPHKKDEDLLRKALKILQNLYEKNSLDYYAIQINYIQHMLSE